MENLEMTSGERERHYQDTDIHQGRQEPISFSAVRVKVPFEERTRYARGLSPATRQTLRNRVCNKTVALENLSFPSIRGGGRARLRTLQLFSSVLTRSLRFGVVHRPKAH